MVFGTGGMLWASLTLGLLTVPVVIVSTEEALRAIPGGVREGSLALGATKFQTLMRVLVPMASPGMMTGFILAMARAAGEVAPLMITGVVKLAPTLPVDGHFRSSTPIASSCTWASTSTTSGSSRPTSRPQADGVRHDVAAAVDRAGDEQRGDLPAKQHAKTFPVARDLNDDGPELDAPRSGCTTRVPRECVHVIADENNDTTLIHRRSRPPQCPSAEAGRLRDPIVRDTDLRLYYGASEALYDITMDFPRHQVTALIGPSGCGKSTLLRCLNRMNDLIDDVPTTGEILLDGQDITDPTLDVIELRRRVGMVFQRPTPFPKSIYENVAYGLRIAGIRDRAVLDEAVEKSLRRAALWDEVKDRLHESALGFSGGQHQRLCIARAIAVDPEIILMDEPCSALGPAFHHPHRRPDRRTARANTRSSSSPTTCSRRPACRTSRRSSTKGR